MLRISSHGGIMRSKSAWFLVGLCVVAFLAIVRWPKEAKKASIETESVERVRGESVEEPQERVVAEVPVAEKKTLQEDPLPEKWPQKEPEKVEMDIVKTLQGVVTNNDPCFQLMSVDGFDFDTGPVDVSGIQAGDVVKARYIEKTLGRRKTNVLKSLELIAASQQSPTQGIIPERKPFRAVAEQEDNEEFTEEEPPAEPGEWPTARPFAGQGPSGARPEFDEERPDGGEQMAEGPEAGQEDILDEPEPLDTGIGDTMEGRVIACDHCFQLITVEGMDFDGRHLDLSGIQPGDYVKITYTEGQNGNVLDSIEVIERKH